jgi:hypothetical protein
MTTSSANDFVADLQFPIFVHKNSSRRELTETNNGPGSLLSFFYGDGIPGAATPPTAGLSGEVVGRSTPGVIALPTTTSGSFRISHQDFVTNVTGAITDLYDRVWHNNGINLGITTSQTINSIPFPARDEDARSVGLEYEVFLEIISGQVNANLFANTFSIEYTDSAGVPRTASNTAVGNFLARHSLVRFELPTGSGVSSIQSFTTTSTSFGALTAGLVVARHIATSWGGGASTYSNRTTFSAEEVYDDAGLFLVSGGGHLQGDSAIRTSCGVLVLVQG